MRLSIANTPFERFERIEQRLNSHDESIAKPKQNPPKQRVTKQKILPKNLVFFYKITFSKKVIPT